MVPGAQNLFSDGNSLRNTLSPTFLRIWSFKFKAFSQASWAGTLVAEQSSYPSWSPGIDPSALKMVSRWGAGLQSFNLEELSLENERNRDQVQGRSITFL